MHESFLSCTINHLNHISKLIQLELGKETLKIGQLHVYTLSYMYILVKNPGLFMFTLVLDI